MADEKNLEQFKEEFIKDYIDRSLDRLLDLRNAVKKAETYEEMNQLVQTEQATVLNDMDVEAEKNTSDKEN